VKLTVESYKFNVIRVCMVEMLFSCVIFPVSRDIALLDCI
jgi:hypothetical protein